MTRKRKPAPATSAASNAAGIPITTANCADLTFARRIARQLRSGHGGKLHQRDRLRRASPATHDLHAFKHLYHGTYTNHEQRLRDLHPLDAAP